MENKIIYTYTDEAPAIATHSLYPIIKSFLNNVDIDIDLVDISLAARVLSSFPEYLTKEQQKEDSLNILGKLTLEPKTNIIKLPNISASLSQLQACIKELQDKGYNIPNYPSSPKNEMEKDIQKRYSKVLGSAVNPVLREGNSDRRSSKAVKEYAKANPHKNGKWNKNVKTDVFYMDSGDFYANEKSKIFTNPTNLTIKFKDKDGNIKILKDDLKILKDEVVDATFMSVKELDKTIKKSIEYAKDKELLYSVHLKATMMKISDPVIFGHFVKIFFNEIFDEFKDELKSAGVSENNGLKDLFEKIENLDIKEKIYAKFDEIYKKRPKLSMVDSDRGITNLHVPSDVIIDASMPAMIKNSGKMWDKDGNLVETLAVIPDRSYALVYKSMIEDLKENGELNPSIIGSVSNIGLMAKKAEEYGSHDKTFIMPNDGEIVVGDSDENIVFKFSVEKGDIYRMTQAKDEAIKNWINLAISRAKETGYKTIFWLDNKREHDKNIKKIVLKELKKYDISNLDIEILNPYDAIKVTNKTIRDGKNCISVTGNVLRDYLTDLYPIIELGTSAKMLSIVPFLNGGAMFETGAGGSAPKHVLQLIEENHLRWDSLGEFMAIAQSLEFFGKTHNNENANILANALDIAISKLLKNGKSPKRKVGEIDNRNSHFYLALYFAKELENSKLGSKFSKLAKNLEDNKEKINIELLKTQGKKVDLGGYYLFDKKKVDEIMRCSKTLNNIIDEM
ncbi:isocitrate dehydrogenase, monomeric [Campylobacter blaseri]|uniref:Isocitrate dehydrogenase [NADP] n=1 Tax=Campylobacter blaseri TaxID=2042961 RepID=A0A2P8R2P0_9BACT|nr:NADP-dependent isocitrate dehydrogenase [Campylobacter blaseri]PSM52728.1 isocitrate dehydrogenase (NADP(+)) [Campylobacter blaseri]PSM54376.1 isocitrate dehydrogenase (NADP(+)) [Campylobacter blaseri]QKF86032.1 isocitrate dehydrogenase, monomeric [Campylobacter blaseri]